jgi:hypothetical protein
MRIPSLVFAASAALMLAACSTASVIDGGAASSAALSASSEAAEASSAASSLVAFDPAALPAYQDSCTKVQPAANTTVRYEDKANGFSIELPFNEAWGSAPYVMDDDGMHFGQPVSYESPDGGCANEAAFTMKVLPKRTVEEAMQATLDDYDSHAMPEPDHGWGVNLYMVDRRVAMQWGIGEWVCPMPVLEIPGAKANVQLSVACHYPFSPKEALEQLEVIMHDLSFLQ